MKYVIVLSKDPLSKDDICEKQWETQIRNEKETQIINLLRREWGTQKLWTEGFFFPLKCKDYRAWKNKLVTEHSNQNRLFLAIKGQIWFFSFFLESVNKVLAFEILEPRNVLC